jgi:hypothetical protein
VQSSRQQLLEASKIKWFGLNYFVKLQWSIWQAQQFLTGEDLKQKRKQKGEILTITNKKWMSWYCQWALQQQSKLVLQVSQWSLSPHRYISILTAHKTSCASQHVLLICSRLESFAHPVSTQEMSYESGEEHTGR